MTGERYNSLMREETKLTSEEIEEGWYFCPDWDYLLIHPQNIEWESCSCNIKVERG